jgi:hypothetical protein
MPTIFRGDGFRVYFYSREQGEPHVHIDRGGATAKVCLENVVLAGSGGFSARDLGDVLRLVRGGVAWLLCPRRRRLISGFAT